MKRLLITGISGMLGNNLAVYFRDSCEVLGLYCTHPVTLEGIRTQPADLLSADEIGRAAADFDPNVVVHCASLTDVDFCERHQAATHRINVQGTAAVAQAMPGARAKLIYISSDSVYDGTKGNFSEDDPVAPRNYYGRTKYEGELEALKHDNTLVLRTNIFGWNIQDKAGLGELILRELAAGKQFTGFHDAHFSSIYTMLLAEVMAEAVDRNLTGVYNCGSSTSMSKYDFAVYLAQRLKLDTSLLVPVSLLDFPFVAQRGLDLSLNVDKLTGDLGHALPTITESVDAFCEDHDRGLPEAIKHTVEAETLPPLIPYGRQMIDQDDIDAVVEVLRSDWITQGPGIEVFERALCETTGAKYAVAVANGTAALHLACLAAGIEPGDEAIVSPMTFAASANCVLYCGGTPVFVDICRQTANIDPDRIQQALTDRTRAIIPVHYAGHACDMNRIAAIAKAHNLTVIEDAAHALGGEYHGKAVGACDQSDMAILSFHPVKHITTGEGGAVLTRRADLYEKLQLLRNHGITKDHRRHESAGAPWYYEMQAVGFNYRLTSIQAALGSSQLKKLPGFLARRREIVQAYAQGFAGNEAIELPTELDGVKSAWHLYVIRLRGDTHVARRRRALYDGLRERNIGVQIHYVPVHHHPIYRNLGETGGSYPVTEDFYGRCLSLPMFPAMTDADVQRVITEVTAVAATL